MQTPLRWAWLVTVLVCATSLSSGAAMREEHFDREPPNWEGVNNRNKFFEPKTVEQNFGYSAATSHAGGQAGEIGGRVNPAGEPAFYGYRLPEPLIARFYAGRTRFADATRILCGRPPVPIRSAMQSLFRRD